MAGNSASSYSEMDGIQKAAILLITLGPEKAAVVFKHLKEDEICLLYTSSADLEALCGKPYALSKIRYDFSSYYGRKTSI